MRPSGLFAIPLEVMAVAIQPTATHQFDIATYNVNRNDLTERRIGLLLKRIRSLAPAIIGFQEYPTALTPHILEVLPKTRYDCYLGLPYEDLDHHPIYWDTEAFELVPGSERTEYLGPTPHLFCKHPMAITVRMASSVMLRAKASGKRIVVTNAQLENVSGEARMEGVNQILGFLRCWPDGEYHKVLLGDLNYSTAGPNATHELARPHRVISGFGLINCWDAANPGVPAAKTFHGNKGEDHIDEHGCYNPDHIWIDKNLRAISCRVDEEPVGVRSSDHFPLVARLGLEND